MVLGHRPSDGVGASWLFRWWSSGCDTVTDRVLAMASWWGTSKRSLISLMLLSSLSVCWLYSCLLHCYDRVMAAVMMIESCDVQMKSCQSVLWGNLSHVLPISAAWWPLSSLVNTWSNRHHTHIHRSATFIVSSSSSPSHCLLLVITLIAIMMDSLSTVSLSSSLTVMVVCLSDDYEDLYGLWMLLSIEIIS